AHSRSKPTRYHACSFATYAEPRRRPCNVAGRAARLAAARQSRCSRSSPLPSEPHPTLLLTRSTGRAQAPGCACSLLTRGAGRMQTPATREGCWPHAGRWPRGLAARATSADRSHRLLAWEGEHPQAPLVIVRSLEESAGCDSYSLCDSPSCMAAMHGGLTPL
ncbi:hypothetical protein Dimus_032101, partial [Dionaea muscipula]